MTEFFSHPLNTFGVGLALGLGLAAYLFLSGLWRRRELRKEVQALKDQLHRQMTILDKGNEKILAELEQVRKENENLRITVATLKNKPGRAELLSLHLYDRALHLMQRRAPGFAPAWEAALAEAQQELEKTDSGLVALVRKAFRPALPRGGQALPGEDDTAGGETSDSASALTDRRAAE